MGIDFFCALLAGMMFFYGVELADAAREEREPEINQKFVVGQATALAWAFLHVDGFPDRLMSVAIAMSFGLFISSAFPSNPIEPDERDAKFVVPFITKWAVGWACQAAIMKLLTICLGLLVFWPFAEHAVAEWANNVLPDMRQIPGTGFWRPLVEEAAPIMLSVGVATKFIRIARGSPFAAAGFLLAVCYITTAFMALVDTAIKAHHLLTLDAIVGGAVLLDLATAMMKTQIKMDGHFSPPF